MNLNEYSIPSVSYGLGWLKSCREKKMRVLFFASSALPRQGGVEYKNHNLANALVDRGLDVIHSSFYLPDSDQIMDKLPRRYRQKHYWLPPIKGLFHTEIAGLYLRYMKRKFDCDIVVASMAYPCG